MRSYILKCQWLDGKVVRYYELLSRKLSIISLIELISTTLASPTIILYSSKLHRYEILVPKCYPLGKEKI